MGRTCTICTSDRRSEIDAALVSGTSYRSVAARYGVATSALGRHRRAHLSAALVAVAAQRNEDHAATLVDRIERLIARTERLLTAAEQSGGVTTALAAVREMRELLRLMGAASGELNERPQVTVNLMASSEWLSVRGAILSALMAYPEARAAVSGRLLELEAGR